MQRPEIAIVGQVPFGLDIGARAQLGLLGLEVVGGDGLEGVPVLVAPVGLLSLWITAQGNLGQQLARGLPPLLCAQYRGTAEQLRSEEHTSELQSLRHL